jgi:hypothetical protein
MVQFGKPLGSIMPRLPGFRNERASLQMLDDPASHHPPASDKDKNSDAKKREVCNV